MDTTFLARGHASNLGSSHHHGNRVLSHPFEKTARAFEVELPKDDVFGPSVTEVKCEEI